MGGGSSKNAVKWEGYTSMLLHDDKAQTVEVPDSEEKGATPIQRHPAAKDGFLMYRTTDGKNSDGKDEKEAENVMDSGWKCVKFAFEKYKDRQCFGYRPYLDPEKDPLQRGAYKFDTYGSVLIQIQKAGNGLKSLDGIEDQANIGIMGLNRSEWMIAHLANWSQSFRTVALYDTLGAQAVQYIVWHAELVAIYVEKSKLPALFEAIAAASKDEEQEIKLKYIIQMNDQEKYNNKHEKVEQEDIDKAKEFGIDLIGFTDILAKGCDGDGKAKTDECIPKADDLAYIMYTSGTTGNPKGVMLTHSTFACVVASTARNLEINKLPITTEDAHVSYLPLAHSFEAAIITACVSSGAKVAFWAGNIKTISRDWKEIRPTVMFGVPRIYNKTYDKLKAKIKADGGMKEWLFNKGEASSQAAVRQNKRSGFYDKVLWSKVAAEIGFDRVKILASGAAPLPPHIAEFLRIVCPNAIVTQGYGLTETCAVSFFTSFDDQNLGHVGIPVDNIEYRLVDAPECDYRVTDKPYPRGEIQMRGPTIMRGYFKNEEATKKALDENGWFSTGDIGRINPNGTLSIIDRRKNMFKTAMGEYVASEKVEAEYQKAASVNQIFVYGNSFKSFIVAVVVPDPLWLVPILKEKGLWNDEGLTPATQPYCDKFKKICTENADTVKKLVIDDIAPIVKDSDLKKFEKIKDYHIEVEVDLLLQGFNVENNCLTPTMKKKRPQLLKRYVEVIKKLYADNGEPAKDEENWV